LLPDASVVKTGLSPLARGTLHFRVMSVNGSRFIPAGAGNTILPTKANARRTVYPRWRGEHGLKRCTLSNGRGLSPLARGTQKYFPDSKKLARFIPAGAGNTYKRAKNGDASAVYPRWRGEHLLKIRLSQFLSGLSPLARGTL